MYFLRNSAARLCSTFLFTLAIAPTCSGQITIFHDQSLFESAIEDLLFEDFENLSGEIDPLGVDLLDNTISEASDVGPVQPGDIQSGLIITTIDDGIDGLVLLNPASEEGVASNAIGPNLYIDSLRIEFDEAVDAVGFLLYSFENEPGQVDVIFFNGNVVLATENVVLNTDGTFVGISTTGPTVSHIELANEIDVFGEVANGELVDDIQYRLSPPCLLGDLNQDGWVNLMDVHLLIELIIQQQFLCAADVNQDGVVDLLDIEPFVEIMNLH